MFSDSTMRSFAMDELVSALSALDDGWLCEPQRAGMRQASVEVIGFVDVALAKPDRPPLVRAAYASLLAFSYALGKAIDGARVDPVAAETCREALAAMLDALAPLLEPSEPHESRGPLPQERDAVSGDSDARRAS